jgi:hypothetical protein
MSGNELRDFAAVYGNKKPYESTALGVIVSFDAGSTLTVKINGDTANTSGVLFTNQVVPMVGKLVLLQRLGTDIVAVSNIYGSTGNRTQLPFFALRQSVTATTITTAGTWYAVAWDTEDADTDSVHAGTSTDIVIVTQGLYQVSGGWMLSNGGGTANAARVAFFVNGTIQNNAYGSTPIAAQTGFVTAQLSKYLYFTAGDVLTMRVTSLVNGNTTTISTGAGSYLYGRWVGPWPI